MWRRRRPFSIWPCREDNSCIFLISLCFCLEAVKSLLLCLIFIYISGDLALVINCPFNGIILLKRKWLKKLDLCAPKIIQTTLKMLKISKYGHVLHHTWNQSTKVIFYHAVSIIHLYDGWFYLSIQSRWCLCACKLKNGCSKKPNKCIISLSAVNHVGFTEW